MVSVNTVPDESFWVTIWGASDMMRANELSALPSDTGERHLLSAVLERAILDALLPLCVADSRHLRREAREWFNSNVKSIGQGQGISFIDICEYLDIEAEPLRAFLAKHQESPLVVNGDELELLASPYPLTSSDLPLWPRQIRG